jgi:hypothetical protein
MYGRWDENGEFIPFDGEPDDDPVAEAGVVCCNCDSRLRGRRYPYLFCSERCAEEAHARTLPRWVKGDFGPNHERLTDAARQHYAHEGGLEKNDLFIADWVSAARGEGLSSHALTALCTAIMEFARIQ